MYDKGDECFLNTWNLRMCDLHRLDKTILKQLYSCNFFLVALRKKDDIIEIFPP